MSIVFLGRIVEKGSIRYLVANVENIDDKQCNILEVPESNFIDTIKKGIVVSGVDVVNGKLVGTAGSIDRYYQKVDGVVLKSPAVIISEINAGSKNGYTLIDYKGQIVHLSEADTITYGKQNGIANGKVVCKGGNWFISSISGNYEIVEKVEYVADTKVNEDIAVKGSAPRILKSNVTRIHGRRVAESRIRELREDGLTVEKAMVKAVLRLQKIKPFYYALISRFTKVETDELGTIGVSVDKLYYNVDFVKKLSVEELTFVILHEALHIAMQHEARGRKLNHDIYNIASDIMINESIIREFGLKEKNGFCVPNLIKALDSGCYDSSIDLKTDTAEGIYAKLLKAGQDKLNNKESTDEQNKSNSGASTDEQRQGNSETSMDEQRQGNNTEKRPGRDNGTGRKGSVSDELANMAASALSGEKLTDELIGGDLVITDETANMSDDNLDRVGRELVKRAVTRAKLSGYSPTGASELERALMEVSIVPVNFRHILRSRMNKMGSTITTYAKPDKRFISRGMLMPGMKKLENTQIDGIKLCIDVSGSMRDEDISVVYRQIMELIHKYKCYCEVIFWSTRVHKAALVGKDKPATAADLLKIKPVGTGGTDPMCLYEFFINRKKIDRRAIEPEIIIIFSDGDFEQLDTKSIPPKLRNKTVWVIDEGSYKQFKEPFGVKATYNK